MILGHYKLFGLLNVLEIKYLSLVLRFQSSLV